MKHPEKKAGKELYHQLRALSWEQLWDEEVSRFNQASPKERIERVAVVRAVGVVFSESGRAEQKEEVRLWLRGLLQDPGEKIRRYAMAALPKIGAGQKEESELLAMLQKTEADREKKFLSQALEKIGGKATLEMMKGSGHSLSHAVEQKLRASIARDESPSSVCMTVVLTDIAGLRIHLRGRRGLEEIVRQEAEEFIKARGKFRIDRVGPGLVALVPAAPFSLADIYALRCFGTVGFVPGADQTKSIEALAPVIAAPLSRRVFQAFTEGTIRYRLNFIGKGHQRSAVRALAARVYALCPEILNDARDVTWTIDVYSGARGHSVELRPNLTPDPRFNYRKRDVPAASHPQLAACMARLAGRLEIVWDPFCGSGLELIESALLGGARVIHGTDLSAEAISITRENFTAANVKTVSANFVCQDFRDYAASSLGPDSVNLIITNPPLGMRVPVADLHGLIEDLFKVAATVLRPGGRLALANPVSMKNIHPLLQLESRRPVDFGGFDCRMEKYFKRSH
jgi:predicted RNA methylase